jgi:hypothetical protein
MPTYAHVETACNQITREECSKYMVGGLHTSRVWLYTVQERKKEGKQVKAAAVRKEWTGPPYTRVSHIGTLMRSK